MHLCLLDYFFSVFCLLYISTPTILDRLVLMFDSCINRSPQFHKYISHVTTTPKSSFALVHILQCYSYFCNQQPSSICAITDIIPPPNYLTSHMYMIFFRLRIIIIRIWLLYKLMLVFSIH